MTTRYTVVATVLSGPPQDLTMHGLHTLASSDIREIAEQRATYYRSPEGSLDLIEQLQRSPEYKDVDLRVQDIEVLEVDD